MIRISATESWNLILRGRGAYPVYTIQVLGSGPESSTNGRLAGLKLVKSTGVDPYPGTLRQRPERLYGPPIRSAAPGFRSLCGVLVLGVVVGCVGE